MRPSQISAVLEREFLGAARNIHTPVMLWGPPGIGKSQLVAQTAACHRVPVVDIRLSQMEPTDLRGIPFRVGNLVEWAIPAMLPDKTRHGARGVLFLDEINAAPPSVSAAAYQLILDRRLGEYRVPSGWAIFAAGNRQGDRGVTYAMPAPLANRFSHFEVEANLEDWTRWAFDTGVDARLIGFLRFRPELLFDFDPARSSAAFPTPRSWEFASRALVNFADAPDLLPGALEACVGRAAGTELAAWLANLEKLPDVEAILRGDAVAVPEEIDLQYATAAALASRAVRLRGGAQARAALGHILDYAGRFPHREMGVMLVADLQRQLGSELFSVPQFKDWARQVADIVLYE